MSDNNKEFYISNLIIKSVLGTLSNEETLNFQKWMSNSDNKEFYSRILKRKKFEDKLKLVKDLDKEAAYLKLLKRIEKEQQIIKSRPSIVARNIFKYAAVALLLLSVGYYGVSLFYPKNAPERTITTVIDLKPGYNKATLVLEDGTEVNLEKNEFVKQQSLANVKNEYNTLIYKPNRNNDPSKSSGKVGYNTLYVPIGGIYKIVLPDGSTVWLNSFSSLKYPTSFEDDQRIVELSGEAYFDVVKDVRKPFIVKTNIRDISVLGTAFNVSSYNDDVYFAATLTEGRIEIVQGNLDAVSLNPGEQAIVQKESLNTTKVIEVDPKIYSAWKDGTFFFENETLYNILKKVGRWYNFKTEFSDAELGKITFTGLASKDLTAKRLLDRISKSSNINYEIIQNTLNEEKLIKISRKER